MSPGAFDPTGADDWFVTDQHPRGFARLIDGMVADSVPPGDPRLVLGAEVTKLSYGCDGVTLATADGRTFRAQQAISTLPLGVLQRKQQQLFEPPLPAEPGFPPSSPTIPLLRCVSAASAHRK